MPVIGLIPQPNITSCGTQLKYTTPRGQEMGVDVDDEALRGWLAGQRLAVHGTENLYVADCSVPYDITSAAPNLTGMMIGERMADWLTTPLTASRHTTRSDHHHGISDHRPLQPPRRHGRVRRALRRRARTTHARTSRPADLFGQSPGPRSRRE